jgi:hypothetical protein
MWIERENRSPHTVAQYRRIARQFFKTVGKPLSMVNYADLSAWAKSIEGTPATKRTKVSAAGPGSHRRPGPAANRQIERVIHLILATLSVYAELVLLPSGDHSNRSVRRIWIDFPCNNLVLWRKQVYHTERRREKQHLPVQVVTPPWG